MAEPDRCVLTLNGGSSSIKFAMFETVAPRARLLHGAVEGIGSEQALLRVKGPNPADTISKAISAPNHSAAIDMLMSWLEQSSSAEGLAAIGHRVVHGGPTYSKPQRITPEMIEELRRLSPFDPDHLPEEIQMAEAFRTRFPDVPQVACFDTAFHHDLPRVARMLPIPRRYEAMGVRRYGFHGLSYTYLMQELERLAGPEVAQGRIVMAHLGSGASLAAVNGGRPIDTSMSFTPASGIPMSTRSGDLDPSLFSYLARTENLDLDGFNAMINKASGLLGISETSGDMQQLLKIEAEDSRAAEAIALFCYQTRKWIGSFAAAMGGIDTLIFAGGVGENAPVIRARICADLGFLGLVLDDRRNADNEGIISNASSRVDVRVIQTDEERVIAALTCDVLGLGATEKARP